jgi:hypothetical protein
VGSTAISPSPLYVGLGALILNIGPQPLRPSSSL